MQHTFASKQEVKSVYIHVPFCLSKCHYCDIYSEAASESRINQWHETILTEMRLILVRRWQEISIKVP